MYHKDIVIEDSFNVTGHGKTLTTELDFNEHGHKFSYGDTLSHEGKLYEVTAIEAALKKVSEDKIQDFVAFLVKEITETEKFEKEFFSLLWQMPQHWFSEVNNGIRVMEPISYALYQAFCLKFGYDWDGCDYREMMLPIFYREKKKYLQLVDTKNKLLKGKPILGMIHLSMDEADDSRVQRAIREMKVLEEEGVHGIIVENYHGSVNDIKEFFELAKTALENSKLIIGINILPNEFAEALELAGKVGAKFIQLDYVAGTYYNSKFIYEPYFMSVREKYPHIVVLGGVWPKYYQPVKDSVLKDDIHTAMRRADAIVVTGEGTGKTTPFEKIEEFRKIAKGFPLIVGAGLTPENVSKQLKVADGAIVGSCFKPAGVTRKEIKRELVKQFMDEVKKVK